VVGSGRKAGYSDTDATSYYDDAYDAYDVTKNAHNDRNQERITQFSKILGVAFIALLVGFFAGTLCSDTPSLQQKSRNFRKHQHQSRCRFCDQSLPKLHHDKSYTIQTNGSNANNANENELAEETQTVTVVPMTISYDYELRDGEMIFTKSGHEVIPNFDFDFAVLELTSLRNVNRETGEEVSLDEVYVHHINVLPINMLGAEVGNRDEDDPYMRFPEGTAIHILADEYEYLHMNAHLLSNKNLAPIEGSIERAHKECNECFYAPGKGSNCTPEVSGTFLCCGDSLACTAKGEDCACATNNAASHKRYTTKYRMELELLISKDIDQFQRIDQWNFAAPACSINIFGDSILEDYPPDNFCARQRPKKGISPMGYESPKVTSVLYPGGGSFFHQVPENNKNPYLKTSISVLAPTGGQLMWAQSHLHTGGINATLYKNGDVVCTTTAFHGSDPDSSSNAGNEQNHLVRIGSCYDQLPAPVRFEAGDVFITESYYYSGTNDERFSSVEAAGEHKNVMSMFLMGVILDGNSEFLTKKRTSFNLWNDFVHVAGLETYKSEKAPRGH